MTSIETLLAGTAGLALLLPLSSCQLPSSALSEPSPLAEAEITAVLDDFHLAASEAQEERYFGHLSEEAVFLGTDASERWTKEEFRAYVHPYFSAGRGWTYTPTARWIQLDDSGDCAWFDERLHNEKYGETRGSGALVRRDGVWRIAQYNLTIPIPNELAGEFVERIQQRE